MTKTQKFDHPTSEFKFRISKRLNILSKPKTRGQDLEEGMPPLTSFGVRATALRGVATERHKDLGYPYVRQLLLLKTQYKKVFPPERLERIEKLLQLSNQTCYSKYGNCQIDVKKSEQRKKKGGDGGLKRLMDKIQHLSNPRRTFAPPPVDRGKKVKLEQILPRLILMSQQDEHKCHKRLSQDIWYKDPIKVSPKALQYVITENVKKLATPRVYAPQD